MSWEKSFDRTMQRKSTSYSADIAHIICRKAMVFLPALLFIILSAGGADASWLLNSAEFHASAHGRTGCTDCHGNVTEQLYHPNPANLDEPGRRSFHSAQCLDCHDGIGDELEEGIHGSIKIQNNDKYGDCLKCHRRPHQQPFLGADRPDNYIPRKPADMQCDACHEKRSTLPPFAEEDADCMRCHQRRDTGNPQDVAAIQHLCFHCHGKGRSQAQTATSKRIPLMSEAAYGETPHKDLACTACHKNATAFGHGRQEPVNCRGCHSSHIEKDTHGAHFGVTCQTCHLKGIVPFRDKASRRLDWRIKEGSTDLSVFHNVNIRDGQNSCKRCHYSGNDLGAASVVLPAKSILCMPCHAGTLTLDDAVSMTAFVIFLLGMAAFFSVLLSGTMRHVSSRNRLRKLLQGFLDILGTVFSPKIVPILKALFWDAFLQRRLYKRSPGRWFIHGLIFYPFAFRFFWGFVALLGFLWEPGNPLVWKMVNQNNPLVAIPFDITGVMILLGVILAWIRGSIERQNRAEGAPPRDRIALVLIGLIVVIGFLLEGMRIVMTGHPEGTGYSFVGYWISFWFYPSRGLPDIYTFLWYAHAVFTGAFVAYIPFSRLLHMILAPVVISINAASSDQGAHH